MHAYQYIYWLIHGIISAQLFMYHSINLLVCLFIPSFISTSPLASVYLYIYPFVYIHATHAHHLWQPFLFMCDSRHPLCMRSCFVFQRFYAHCLQFETSVNRVLSKTDSPDFVSLSSVSLLKIATRQSWIIIVNFLKILPNVNLPCALIWAVSDTKIQILPQ